MIREMKRLLYEERSKKLALRQVTRKGEHARDRQQMFMAGKSNTTNCCFDKPAEETVWDWKGNLFTINRRNTLH